MFCSYVLNLAAGVLIDPHGQYPIKYGEDFFTVWLGTSKDAPTLLRRAGLFFGVFAAVLGRGGFIGEG